MRLCFIITRTWGRFALCSFLNSASNCSLFRKSGNYLKAKTGNIVLAYLRKDFGMWCVAYMHMLPADSDGGSRTCAGVTGVCRTSSCANHAVCMLHAYGASCQRPLQICHGHMGLPLMFLMVQTLIVITPGRCNDPMDCFYSLTVGHLTACIQSAC